MTKSTLRCLLAPLGLTSVLTASGCTDTTTREPAEARSTTTSTGASSRGDLANLAPRAGFGIYDAGDGRCTPLDGSGLDQAVPVASVFKLWVLATVARSIDSGNLAWDSPVAIQDALRSDPSGEVYRYQAGQQDLGRWQTQLRALANHLEDLEQRAASSALQALDEPDTPTTT